MRMGGTIFPTFARASPGSTQSLPSVLLSPGLTTASSTTIAPSVRDLGSASTTTGSVTATGCSNIFNGPMNPVSQVRAPLFRRQQWSIPVRELSKEEQRSLLMEDFEEKDFYSSNKTLSGIL